MVLLHLAVIQCLVPRAADNKLMARQLPKNVTNISALRLKLFIFTVNSLSDQLHVSYFVIVSAVVNLDAEFQGFKEDVAETGVSSPSQHHQHLSSNSSIYLSYVLRGHRCSKSQKFFSQCLYLEYFF